MAEKLSAPPVITLTTDFGTDDEYVGMVKGMILKHCPQAMIVDLTHAIEPQNIVRAAMSIGASFRFFPEGTVHLVVVDPGVGTDRRLLAVNAAGHFFVAPDNGVLTPILSADLFQKAFQLSNRALFAPTISRTFHGRDIIAPVAAAIACGLEISAVGPMLSREECLQVPMQAAECDGGQVSGEIVHIDRFGNICTSIRAADLAHLASGPIRIMMGGLRIGRFGNTYSEVEPGEFIALLDSKNCLEIAVNCGNAAKRLGCRPGDPVLVSAGS